MPDPKRDQELLEAVEAGDADRVRDLLTAGASPDAKDDMDGPVLVKAAEGDSLEILEALLAAGATTDAATSGGDTAVLEAARSAKLDMVKALVARGAAVGRPDKNGWTPLHWAIHWSRQAPNQPTRPGYVETIQTLIAARAPIDVQGQYKFTPLFMAASNGDPAIVRLLLDAGADVTIPDEDGILPVMRAASRGFVDVVALLAERSAGSLPEWARALARSDAAALQKWLKAGGDANAADPSGLTPLGLAARLGDAASVELLLKAGAGADEPCCGETPLLSAARLGHAEAGALLAGSAKQVDVADEEGDTPLVHAARTGARALVARLVARKAKLTGKKGRTTALQAAIQNGHVDVALDLADAGADPDAGSTPPLAAAAWSGLATVVEKLIQKGADMKKHGGAALLHAASEGHASVVRALLAGGADHAARDESQRQPLGVAAWHGRDDVVAILVEAGASLDARAEGLTALTLAAQMGHVTVVRRLLAAGAGLKAKGRLVENVAKGDQTEVQALLGKGGGADAADGFAGWSALTWAALLGYEEIARALLEKGADPRATAKFWPQNALTAASHNGHAAIVQLLLQAGAISKDPSVGEKALFVAAGRGHAEVVKALVAAGVPVDAKGERQRTPLFEAAEKGRSEVVEALLALGADASARLRFGDTPAGEAANRGHVVLARRLQEAAKAGRKAAPAANKELVGAAATGDLVRVTAALAAGAEVDAKDAQGQTAAQLAMKNGTIDILDALLKAGAKVGHLLTSLDMRPKNTAVVRRVIESGADVNGQSQQKMPPLAMAAFHGNDEIVSLMLARGAEVDGLDDRGRTALVYACGNGHETVAEILLRAGADAKAGAPLGAALARRMLTTARALLQAAVPEGKPAANLLRAIARGDASQVRAQLAAGASATAAEPATKWTALQLACVFSELECAQALLEAGATVKVARDGWTPLALAFAARNEALVDVLLKAGADPDGSAGGGAKLLLAAISEGQVWMVERLLAAGAKPDVAVQGAKAIHVAAAAGLVPALSALLRAGAKVDAKDASNRTPLMKAVQFNVPEAVSALVAAGANVNTRWMGKTALHWAIETGRRGIASLLVAAGARPDPPDDDPRGPLHAAALRGDLEIVERLLGAGAPHDAKDAAGRTPLIEAARAGHARIVERLLERGAPAADEAVIVAAEEGEAEVLGVLAGRGSALAAALTGLLDGTADGAAPLPECAALLAARWGSVDVAQRLMARPPGSGLARAIEIARFEGFDDVARLFGDAGPGPAPKPHPSEASMDAMQKDVAWPELPLVFSGAFGRYHQAPAAGFDSRVATQIFLGDNAGMETAATAFGAEMSDLGFAHMGDLVCDRVKDVVVRGYGSPAGQAWTVWNLGVFGAARELVTQFEDDSGIATTTLEQAGDPARRSYSRCLPWASAWVLHHKHVLRVERRMARGARAIPAEASLAALSAAIDRSLVRQFRS